MLAELNEKYTIWHAAARFAVAFVHEKQIQIRTKIYLATPKLAAGQYGEAHIAALSVARLAPPPHQRQPSQPIDRLQHVFAQLRQPQKSLLLGRQPHQVVGSNSQEG